MNRYRNSGIYSAVVLTATLLLAIVASLTLGAVNISPKDIFMPESTGYYITWELRLPRTILAILTGSALAVSGMILQAIMRNPLASPSIMGISSGGGLGAIIILLLLPQYGFLSIPMAFVGAILAAIGVYLLAWKNGIQPLRLVLSGVAFSSFLGALTSAILVINSDKVVGVLDYLSGSLNGRTWHEVNITLPYIIGGLLATFILHRSLDVIALGDDLAISLGVNLERRRAQLLVIASLLAASAVSVVGLLSFVGLVAPHIARKISGGKHLLLQLNSMLIGATLVLLCDLIGRLLFAPRELPAGILLALLGAPFFLWLLRKSGGFSEN